MWNYLLGVYLTKLSIAYLLPKISTVLQSRYQVHCDGSHTSADVRCRPSSLVVLGVTNSLGDMSMGEGLAYSSPLLSDCFTDGFTSVTGLGDSPFAPPLITLTGFGWLDFLVCFVLGELVLSLGRPSCCGESLSCFTTGLTWLVGLRKAPLSLAELVLPVPGLFNTCICPGLGLEVLELFDWNKKDTRCWRVIGNTVKHVRQNEKKMRAVWSKIHTYTRGQKKRINFQKDGFTYPSCVIDEMRLKWSWRWPLFIILIHSNFFISYCSAFAISMGKICMSSVYIVSVCIEKHLYVLCWSQVKTKHLLPPCTTGCHMAGHISGNLPLNTEMNG